MFTALWVVELLQFWAGIDILLTSEWPKVASAPEGFYSLQRSELSALLERCRSELPLLFLVRRSSL